MKIVKSQIEDVLIIEPIVFGDHRGWFTETYSRNKFIEEGINVEFLQDNHSFSSKKGTLRGLHYQTNPKSQSKLIRCTKGKIMDVAVDLRKGSSTYKKWVMVELSDDNKKQIFIPKGFAHGFVTLTNDVEVQYKVDEYYYPECDRSIRFDDPDIGIEWNIENPVISDKDMNAPFLKDTNLDFSIKILLTGVNGQVGHDLLLEFEKLKLDVIAPSISEFNLLNSDQVKCYIFKTKPDIIIHCAAYTNVDSAEDEKSLCFSTNVEGTKAIVEAAKEIDAKVVYISTDYVFDGLGHDPYTEDNETNPINYYGYTKEQGEKIVKELIDKFFIVRTSWVYGINGNNFVKTMLKLSKTNKEVNVVNDQVGAPTYSKDLADYIVKLIQTNKYGIYHGVNEGYCSWYEFAKAIFAITNTNMIVNPISSEEFPTKAKRPMNSRLSKDNTFRANIGEMPHWENALSRFIAELINQEE